jgi:hypothetical protein
MKCSDVRQILPDAVEGSEDAELQSHLESCSDCAELVSELQTISIRARDLAEIDSPPDRVWVNVANQLRAEGIIREPEAAPALAVRARRRPWRSWWLAPVAAAVIAAGAYQVGRQTALSPAQPAPGQTNVAQHEVQPGTPSSEQPKSPAVSQPANSAAPGVEVAAQKRAPKSSAKDSRDAVEISPPAGPEDEQFLSEVSQRAPGLRATYENQLRAVNAEIRETQEYIRRHPGDLDARQHLMEVFQQKAMLYQLALDRVQ